MLLAGLVAGALLGALVTVLVTGGRRPDPDAEDRTRQATDHAREEGVGSVLEVLRSAPVVLDAEGVVVSAPASAYGTGIVSGRRLALPQLASLVQDVRRDGRVRETEVSITANGGPDRVVGARVGRLGRRRVLVLLDDRTQQRRVEAVRRDFVANVSHELKTPVGAIRLLSEAVQDAAEDPEAVQRFAQRMHRESDRLTALVQRIIDLSRLQSDDPLSEPTLVELDAVVASVIDAHSTDASARGIDLVHGGTPGLAVYGDAEQLGLAVGNLVSNAIAYSPDRSRVAIAARERGDRIQVTVTDQGIGIGPEDQDRIFERFYRCDPARQRTTGGSGLGLSIVKHVVASHGGDVRVWSEVDAGSTFTLSFPRHHAGEPDGDAEVTDDGASDGASPVAVTPEVLPTLTSQEKS
ncbi:two-component sensor histidine kinase [Nocardioidaceae bacterium]|nr:two-component sensor histidine kinase [Nocardioidaceae bacterium]